MSAWRPLVEVLSSVQETAGPGWISQAEAAPEGGRLAAATYRPAAPGVPGSQQAPATAQGASAADMELVRRAAYDEGIALARQEGEALALRYRAAIEALVQARDAMLRGCEADLVRLSLTIAREVLIADVVGREQFTQRMVEHALTLLGDGEPMCMRLSPQDLQALRQHKPELLRRPGVTWQEDEALAMGGVVAEGARGRLDASLIARLEAMGQQLASSGGASP